MPLEQSRIAIAPAVIMHPNSKNIPKGPMTSKQLKKAYKERNAAPKMTKAEQRKEEQKIREEQRLELEKEKRLEREKRKREKKREEEAAAKAERKRLGVPEKSKWVRQSQNRITGFIGLGKRNREEDNTMDADMTRENSVVRDMRPPKNKRLSLDILDEDSGYASPDNDMDTAMLDITLPVNEDDISIVDSQEDNTECTCPKAASQRKARPQINDDELEPVIEQFRSSQLAEAPNFGTIGDADESSFMSTGRFKTPAVQKPAPPSPVRALADPFPASQDYDAQCGDMDDSTLDDNTIMPDADDVFTPSKAKDLPKLPSHKTFVSDSIVGSATYHDLFGTDSIPKSAEPAHDEIHKTYSPIKSRPNTTTNVPKPPNPASFEADEDYDSYFLTQPSDTSAAEVSPVLPKKTPKKTPKKASQPKPRPQISDDEIDYDAFFATQKPDAPISPIFSRREIKETPPRAKAQPLLMKKVGEAQMVDPFPASQDYFAMCGDDPFEATQAPPPKVPPVVKKAMANTNTQRLMQPPEKPTAGRAPIAAKSVKPTAPPPMQPPAKPPVVVTPKNYDPPPSTDYDGFFSPDAPHAKPFQKTQAAKSMAMAPPPKPVKPLPKQFEASQDYFAMCGDDDEDFDGDIAPIMAAPKITMSPENLAKHNAYNMRQNAKAVSTMKPPPQAQDQRIGKFVLPVTPNNPAQHRQPLRQVQSAAPNIPRTAGPTFAKPPVLAKQTSNPTHKPSMPRAVRAPAQRHSAPPRAVPTLYVSDDFEVVSGTQLMRELSEDAEPNVKTPKVAAQESTGTKHNLSQHLEWLIAQAPRPGQNREPLMPREQNVVRPPSFRDALSKQKRASYPHLNAGTKPPNTNAARFLPTKVEKKPTAQKQPSAPRYQESATKPTPKTALKPVPSVEVDDPMGLEFPSGTQLMREMAEEEEQERRSRSATIVPAPRPPQPPKLSIREASPVYKSFESDSQFMREMEEEETEEKAKRASETPHSQSNLHAREGTPLAKNFQTNSQILRELAEEEDQQMAKKAMTTPRPPQQSTANKNISNDQLKPLSFHIASDELQTLSQIEREMAGEETATKLQQNSNKTPAGEATPKPVSFHFCSDDILSDSAIALELAQEEQEAKDSKHNPSELPKSTTAPPRGMISIAQVPHAYPPTGPNGEVCLMRIPCSPRDRMDMYDLDDMPLSQYESEMAKDDAEDAKRKTRRERKGVKEVAAVEKRRKQEEWMVENAKNAVPREQEKKLLVELDVGEEEILTNSQLMKEMEEEEKLEKKSREQTPATAGSTTKTTPIVRPTGSKTPAVQSKKQGDWLTRTAEQRNAVGSTRKGRPKPPSKRGFPSPVITRFEIEDDDAIAKELAEEEAASRHTTPVPAYQALSSSEIARDVISRRRQASSKRNTPFPTARLIKGRRQFSGLATPIGEPTATSMPPPSTPRNSGSQRHPSSAQPSSSQPRSNQPSSATPIDVKRARKPLFFQEKPEDREESIVFNSKLQADREEKKRKEIEEEQKRQDEWLRQLCSTQGALEIQRKETEERKANNAEDAEWKQRSGKTRVKFDEEFERMKTESKLMRKKEAEAHHKDMMERLNNGEFDDDYYGEEIGDY